MHLEKRTAEESFDVMMISIDLAVDRKRCNLMEKSNRTFWLQQTASGRVIGAFQGPPCEMHTAAREHELPGGKGPRPLRSREEPWCLEGLRPKELAQMEVANTLMWFSLQLLGLLIATGAAARRKVGKHVEEVAGESNECIAVC